MRAGRRATGVAFALALGAGAVGARADDGLYEAPLAALAGPVPRSAIWVRPDPCASPAPEPPPPGPRGVGRTLAAHAERPPCRLSEAAAERNVRLLEGLVLEVTVPPRRRRGR